MDPVDPDGATEWLKKYLERLDNDPAFAEAEELDDIMLSTTHEYLSDLIDNLFANEQIASFLLLVRERINDLPYDDQERILRHLRE